MFTTIGLYYPHDGRKLRRFIMIVLKKQAAIRIDRINYVQSYELDQDGSVKKTAQKILHITCKTEKKQHCIDTIKKLLGQDSLRYFVVQSDSQENA